jgi:predicted ATPase/DNA-binding CsgD family transcriptional regulator
MTPSHPHTTFVGREHALREVRDLLGSARLVTITGTGGIGKTRLAVELLARAARAFPDGVAVVELAALGDGAEVASATATALAVTDQSNRPVTEQIARHLAGRRILLLVDNCEHVLEATSDLLSYLLDAVDGLTVLTTSREPLGLAGEQIFPLGPLALTAGDSRGSRAADGSEAVRLLVERARAFLPQFAVDDDNREAVVQLCTRLDGMPLAIELAAARLRTLSVEQVLGRLDERFKLLSKGVRAELPRHRTLWDLVDWSHDLCTDDERRLWARLSVFPATFDLDAAEAVCGYADLDPADVLDVLDRLVAKSIVTAEPGGAAMRYRMLVTMREYGARRLADLNEVDQANRGHRDYYLGRAAVMVRDWCGPRQPEALAVMRADHANLLAALAWSTSTPGESDYAAELGSLLRYHWIAGGFLSDGRRWLERILQLDQRPAPERGAALWVAAWVSLIQGDRDAGAAFLAECREVAAVLGDEVLVAHADHWTGLMQLFSGELVASLASYEAAVEVFERVGDQAAAQTALFQLAMAQTYADQPEAALDTCDRVLALSEERGEQWCRAYSLWVTGICQWHRGQPEASYAAAVGALELQRAFQDGICIALSVELMSWLAGDAGQPERAAELAGGSQAVWRQLGTSIEAFGPDLTADSRSKAAETDSQIGADEAQRLRESQVGFAKLEVVEFALGARASARASQPEESPLTRREAEVAGLIAEGLSNRAIAERLVISHRTVDGHVERILAKLEFTSRTQVAAWATTHSGRNSVAGR